MKSMLQLDMRSKSWNRTVLLWVQFVLQLLCVEHSGAVTVCEWAKENYLQKLEALSDKEDVSGIINEAQSCIPAAAEIPFPKLLRLAKRGYFAEANHILNAAEAASNYRDVSKDIALYEGYLQLADGANFIKADTTARLKKRGLLNKNNSQKNCGAVDLRSKFGEVRDQDSIGWCYAFVVADMIQFKTGIRVSAADVAVNYTSEYAIEPWRRIFIKDGEVSREDGSPYHALRTLRKIGVCRESDFPSEYSGQDAGMKTFIEFVEKASEKDRLAYLTGGVYGRSSRRLYRPDSEICTPATAFRLAPTQLQGLNEIAERSIGSRAFYDLAKKNCDGKRIPIEVPDLQWKAEAEKHDFHEQLKFVDEKLNNKLPLIMSWYSKLSQGVRDRGSTQHASLVVGRRVSPRTGLCEYLVRNSWGKACPYEDFDCEDGHVWLPREHLHQSMTGAMSFEK